MYATKINEKSIVVGRNMKTEKTDRNVGEIYCGKRINGKRILSFPS